MAEAMPDHCGNDERQQETALILCVSADGTVWIIKDNSTRYYPCDLQSQLLIPPEGVTLTDIFCPHIFLLMRVCLYRCSGWSEDCGDHHGQDSVCWSARDKDVPAEVHGIC